MELTRYLTEQDISQREFAERIGVAHETVNRWINGHRAPRPAMIHRIERATGGAVGEADFAGPDAAPAARRTRLAEYLADSRMTQRAFAREIGVTVEAVGTWVAGTRIPRRAQMAKIVDATGGAVRPGDFYEHGDEAA